jgi:hypothetical protein
MIEGTPYLTQPAVRPTSALRSPAQTHPHGPSAASGRYYSLGASASALLPPWRVSQHSGAPGRGAPGISLQSSQWYQCDCHNGLPRVRALPPLTGVQPTTLEDPVRVVAGQIRADRLFPVL